MKRGFTLIELMTVVGIMAMLGVAATSGYAALQRGMAERGAVAAVNALLRSAKERAKVDRVPTAVFFYNRLLREADADNNAVVVGEAVAVRRAGRISYVRSNMLYDEFTDLSHMFDVDAVGNLESRPTMRLWRFDDAPMTRMQYSLVADAVCQDNEILAVSVQSVMENYCIAGNLHQPQSAPTNHEIRAYGFRKRSGSNSHEPPSWKVGNGYGFEFATIQLPHNFIFGNSGVPTTVDDVRDIKAVTFDPVTGSDQTVDVYFCLPNSGGVPAPHHRAGTATSDEKKTS